MGDRSQNQALTVFVGNLPAGTIQADVENFFHGELKCEISNVRLMYDRETNRFRGFGYVEMKDEKSVELALKGHGAPLGDDQFLKVSMANSRDKPRREQEHGQFGRPQTGQRAWRNDNHHNENHQGEREQHPSTPFPTQPPFVAYFSNLDYSQTEENLAEIVEGLKLKSIRLVRDRETNKSRGKAYVEFEDLESLQSSMELNNRELGGRAIKVDVAHPKENDHAAPQQQSAWRTNNQRSDLRDRDRNHNHPQVQQRVREKEPASDKPAENFRVLSEEEEKARPKLNLAPRTKPKEAVAGVAEVKSTKAKEDPFGGAKPRDEFEFQEKMKKLSVSDEAK